MKMARTSQQLSQSEYEAYEKFAVDNGLVLAGDIGRKNGDLLGGHILKLNQEITQATLNAAVQQLRGQLAWRSAAEREFDTIVGQLSPSEKSVVTTWLQHQKQLVLDGDPGLENFSIIVGWLRARNYPISEQNLNTALTNAINGGQRQLHWKQTPATPAHEGGYGRHSGAKFNAKPDDGDRRFINGRFNHSYNEKLAAEVPKKTQDSYWQVKCEELRGVTHGQSEQIRRLYVTRQDGSIDYESTYAKRVAIVEGRRSSI
jgi:hypothetical protein